MERRKENGQTRPHWTGKITRITLGGLAVIAAANAMHYKMASEDPLKSKTHPISRNVDKPTTVLSSDISGAKSQENEVKNPAEIKFHQTLNWMLEKDRDPQIQAAAQKITTLAVKFHNQESAFFVPMDSGVLGNEPFSATTQLGPNGYQALIGYSERALMSMDYSSQDFAESLFKAIYVFEHASQNPESYAHDNVLQDRLSREADQHASILFLRGSSK